MGLDSSENAPLNANRSDDGTWRDENGIALPVSASDLERHEYCPLSWALSRPVSYTHLTLPTKA